MRDMTAGPSGSPTAATLDRMISAAEAACERCRRAVDDPGQQLPPQRQRARKAQRRMEDSLARLRAQRAALDS
jgi:hypothetical protein